MSLFRAAPRPVAPATADASRALYPGASNAATVLYQTWGNVPDVEPILPTFVSYAAEGYASNGVIFSVILSRLMLFSEAEFTWQRLSDRTLYGDQRLALLERPWQGGSTGELLARMEQDVSLSGNAFIRNVDDQELQRLRPDLVTIISGITEDRLGREIRKLIGYGWRSESGEILYFDKDEIAHWSPIPDPLANFRGMSWLTPVVREIEADSDLTRYKTKYLTNAATPNLLIKHPEELDPETVAELRDRIQARHGGMENAFKTLVLDGGADATVIGANLKDLNFSVVQSAGENRIAVAGGVPAVVVGLKEGLEAATYSNYGLAMRRFADITMRPNWRTVCSAIETILPPDPGSRLWFDPSKIAALREGEKERAEIGVQKASTVTSLITAGYTPESAALAAESGDFTKLVHTGMVSVQLQPPGTAPSITAPPDAGTATGGNPA